MLKALLDMVFPPICLLCKGSFAIDGLCPACSAAFAEKTIKASRCTVCSLPFASESSGGHVCGDCLTVNNYFIKACCATTYDGIVHDAIQAFKYGGRDVLSGPLAKIALRALDLPEPPDVAVPVPLHVIRLKKRGYNQSLLLARRVAKHLNIALDFMSLRRTKDTPAQVNLSALQRRENMAGAFEMRRPGAFNGKKVLLVDDVFTTGSTLRECSKVLTRDGARVYALTIARVV